MEINDIKIAKYFSLNEFQCPCCKCVMIHPELLKRLISLRQKVHCAIYINSGYRCKKENDKVGGVPNSYHRYGMAADIFVREIPPPDLATYADIAGFNGIGLYNSFVHVDVRPIKDHWKG